MASWWWSIWPPPTGIRQCSPIHTASTSNGPMPGKHLAFSGGRHFCLGAALARAEGEVGLRTFFDRFPDVRAAGTGSRRDTRVLRGLVDAAGGTWAGTVDGSPRLGSLRREVAAEPVQQSLPGVGRRGGVVAGAGVVEERVVGIGFDNQVVDQSDPIEGRFGRRLGIR